MRSEQPMPGNPWPHDMVISVDEKPTNILELLFIRSAWGLAADAPIPPLDPAPVTGDSSRPPTASVEEWSARWERAWERAWDWYAIHDRNQRPTSELLRELARPGQPLHPSFPPFWRAEHDYEGVDLDALGAWMLRFPHSMHESLEAQPERVCLPSLIDAWEGGLHTIITLPYPGYFADRISRTHLTVSNATRADPSWYTTALELR